MLFGYVPLDGEGCTEATSDQVGTLLQALGEAYRRQLSAWISSACDAVRGSLADHGCVGFEDLRECLIISK